MLKEFGIALKYFEINHFSNKNKKLLFLVDIWYVIKLKINIFGIDWLKWWILKVHIID